MTAPIEEESLERADRLISEGVVGDRGLIASMIIEAVQHEREACAKVADGIAIHLESHGYDTNAAEDIAERIRART